MSDTDRPCPNCGEPAWSHDLSEEFVGVRGKNACNIARVLCAQVEEAAALRSRVTELTHVIERARSLLRSTQVNWHEDCLFELDDLLTANLEPRPEPAPKTEPPAPELSDFARAHAAVTVDGPISQTAWDAFHAAKEKRRREHDATTYGRDDREGRK